MKKMLCLIILLICLRQACFGKHVYKERRYQEIWCKSHNGILEYKNKDNTRVDCLTKTHAVEFDFAQKWAESVGQALYYSFITGKRGMVVLIIEDEQKDYIYKDRLQFMADKLNFDVECMTLKSVAKHKK